MDKNYKTIQPLVKYIAAVSGLDYATLETIAVNELNFGQVSKQTDAKINHSISCRYNEN